MFKGKQMLQARQRDADQAFSFPSHFVTWDMLLGLWRLGPPLLDVNGLCLEKEELLKTHSFPSQQDPRMSVPIVHRAVLFLEQKSLEAHRKSQHLQGKLSRWEKIFSGI